MRARILFVLFCAAATFGCAEEAREDRAAAPSTTDSAAPHAKSPLDERSAESSARSLIGEHSPSAPQDIRSLRPLASDDDLHLVPQPLLSSQSAATRVGDVSLGRTALAPPPIRSSSTGAAAKEPFTTIRVFYGTNRAHTGSRNPKEMYGTRRAETSFGFCDVSIPRNHEKGQLEAPSIWRLEFREDPEKHVVLLRVLEKSCDEFLSALQQKVWGSMEVIDTPDGPALAGGEVFVFVHGYNNTFEDAARRTAQIAHDLKFPGAPVMYSWPSQARSSLDGYRTDGQMAGWSEQHLIEFVSTVAKESGARRIHVIAHSMGNRIVSGALRRLVEQTESGRIPRFNEVILSAPDVDAEYFKTAIAPRIVHSADRITIYSSSRDYALKMSSFFNPHARRRLGEGGKNLTVFPEYSNIDVVDASEVETDLFALNHSYIGDSPTILSDITLLLQGYTTEDRGLASALNRLAWQIHKVGKQISGKVTPPQR